MANKYTFGWSADVTVECGRLDDLLDELDSVCEKFGVGLDLQDGESSSSLVLVPYDMDTLALIIVNDLEKYESGVPWLDEAKTAYHNAVRERRALDADKKRALASAQEAARAKRLLEEGIVIDGKKYRVTEA